MKLSTVATIKVNHPEADFWIIRRGSQAQCGKPVKVFNPEHIGVSVNRTNMLNPQYLYYCLLNLWQQERWYPLATGTLELVNIKVSDIRSITLLPC